MAREKWMSLQGRWKISRDIQNWDFARCMWQEKRVSWEFSILVRILCQNEEKIDGLFIQKGCDHLKFRDTHKLTAKTGNWFGRYKEGCVLCRWGDHTWLYRRG